MKTYKGRRVFKGPDGGLLYLNNKGRIQYVPRVARGLPKRSRKGASHWQLRLAPGTKYCGPAGGAAPFSFPVNSEKRCRAALSYSRFAPRPCGVAACALAEAKKRGWKCGGDSSRARKCGCKNGKCLLKK